MINPSITLKKNSNIQNPSQQYQGNPFAIRDLQNTIAPKNFLTNKDLCHCKHCYQQKTEDRPFVDGNLFEVTSRASIIWLKKLLDNLCLSGVKTLKINLPDLLFVRGQSFQTFQTNRRDGRLIKLSGTTPLKSLYATMVRYRKQYKYMLQINFNQKMFESIDPDFMHLNYFQKFVPSHFHEGMPDSHLLKENVSQFKRFVLHKNKKYQIQQIQEHKMNNTQPFCIVKYTDGNCQLFNQIQFQHFMLGSLTRVEQSVVFVQSYIKYKLETKAIYYSTYTLTPHSVLQEIDRRAQNQVITLLGGKSKYDKDYTDPMTTDEIMQQMMLQTPQKYVNLMTYKIVHYLNMTSRIYIEHIKIKWIVNDLGNIYLQQIMQFEMNQVPRRLIRYRLPPKDEALDLVTNTNNFGDFYLEMKKKKNVNTHRIKKVIVDRNIQDIYQMMNIDPHQPETKEKDQIQLYYQQKLKSKHQTLSTNYVRTGENKQREKDKKRRRTLLENRKALEEKKKSIRFGTLQSTSQQASSIDRKQKIKQNFNRYFTITQSVQAKKGRKLVIGSQTERTINPYASIESNQPQFSHRYSHSTSKALNKKQTGHSISLN